MGLFKKPWEKKSCVFELQEYGLIGGHGWVTVAKSGEQSSVNDAMEHMKPGCHYRLLAKSTEDGKMVGVVWKHYEPIPGGLEADKKEKESKTKVKVPTDPAEVMDAYADKISKDLAPIGKLLTAIDELRAGIFGAQPQQVVVQGEPGIPPPDFDGKLPVWLHPYVVTTIGNEVRSITDHFFKKFESFGLGDKEEKEEEHVILPSPRDYLSEEERGEEEEIEVEEEAVLPPMTTEEKEVVTEEAIPKEEIAAEEEPVSLEGVKACAECGEVKLLEPNGLCAECAEEKASELKESEEDESEEN